MPVCPESHSRIKHTESAADANQVVILGGLLKDKQRLSHCLRGSLAGASMLLVFLHLLRFGSDALNPASLLVNLLWLGLAAAMIWSLLPFSFGGRRQVAGQAVGD